LVLNQENNTQVLLNFLLKKSTFLPLFGCQKRKASFKGGFLLPKFDKMKR